MTLDVHMVYIKVIALNAIYNFIVVTFYIRSFRGLNIHFNSSHFKIYFFWFFQMTSCVNMVYDKGVDLNVISNFVVNNIFIWDHLEDLIFILSSMIIRINLGWRHALYQIYSVGRDLKLPSWFFHLRSF
jgi:hypothetical protein